MAMIKETNQPLYKSNHIIGNAIIIKYITELCNPECKMIKGAHFFNGNISNFFA